MDEWIGRKEQAEYRFLIEIVKQSSECLTGAKGNVKYYFFPLFLPSYVRINSTSEPVP